MRTYLHICPLDKDCRDIGSPWRVYLDLGPHSLAVALRPQDRFARIQSKSPGWFHYRRRA